MEKRKIRLLAYQIQKGLAGLADAFGVISRHIGRKEQDAAGVASGIVSLAMAAAAVYRSLGKTSTAMYLSRAWKVFRVI